MINLLSGRIHEAVELIGVDNYQRYSGFLGTPRIDRKGENPDVANSYSAFWALDNDCYTNGCNYTKIIQMLQKHEGKPNCLFVSAPDVVGNAEQTLIKFSFWQPLIKYYGYPVALVLQDGMENFQIPYDKLDAIFIGGTTEFKLSEYSCNVTKEARKRNKWVHVGRVNSNKRIRFLHEYMQVDSFDGSGYVRFMRKTYEKSIIQLKELGY